MTRTAKSFLFLCGASCAFAVQQQQQDTTLQQNIVDWVKSNGGYFNDKQEFRQTTGPDDGFFGIFAAQDIEEGELLCRVPWKCTLTGWDYELQDGQNGYYCGATKQLYQQLKLGKNSFYGPYMEYLLAQQRGKIPSDWSEMAKLMLQDVIGMHEDDGGIESLPPYDAVSQLDNYMESCEGNPNDDVQVLAALEFMSRSDDEVMIPLFDLYNHVNEPLWMNCAIEVVTKEHQSVLASRTIKAGEEIRYSYSAYSSSASPHVTMKQPDDPDYGTPEFLRDYGFVEPYPQRWIFHDQEVGFDLIVSERGDVQLRWLAWMDDLSVMVEKVDYFKHHLDRLTTQVEPRLTRVEAHLAELQDKHDDDDDDDMASAKELGIIRQYFNALKTALSKAVDYMEEPEDFCTLQGHQDGTSCSLDKITYRDLGVQHGSRTPDEHENFPTYNMEEFYQDVIDLDRSGYQQIEWVRADSIRSDGKTNDICFKLDSMTQTCSCSSAHYHDVAAHFPTRYLEEVKRVAIIGGGDAKMLHEVLKYDTVELVVHLELDQKVTRKSFKYFASQPHFDDERVQWWFGDAIKSLQMLPSHYFGTFDLVFVDLSESSVLSRAVSDRLTAWEVLAKLVAPQGILIKNELYLETISQMFDSTMLIYYEKVPLILSWALTIGSNRKDLLHPSSGTMQKWHSVPTIWEDFPASPVDFDDHFKFVHDYTESNARTQGKCSSLSEEKPLTTKKDIPLAGILLILEAENAAQSLEWQSLEKSISSILTKQGFTGVSSISNKIDDNDKTVGAIIAKEGMVLVRTWPTEKYCAFDVHLWAAFDKMETLEKLLAEMVKSQSVSSYRIITSGIRGTSSETEDKKTLGPPDLQYRDCNVSELKEIAIDSNVVDVAIKESLAMIHHASGIVVVLCGGEGDACRSMDVVSKTQLKVIPLWTCPSVQGFEYSNDNDIHKQAMISCEMSVLTKLQETVAQDSKLSAFVLDPSAPENMAKILDRILMRPLNLKALFAKQFTFISTLHGSTESWPRDFLERRRSEMIDYEHLFRAEVVLQSAQDLLEVGILSARDSSFFGRLVNVTTSLKEATGLDANIRKVEGGVEMVNHYQESTWYTEDDYDRQAGEAQFLEQKPLGIQNVVQFESREAGASLSLSGEELQKAMLLAQESCSEVKHHITRPVGTGGGLAMAFTSLQSTATLVWDGETRVTVSVFVYQPKLMTLFWSHFVNWARAHEMKMTCMDEMPRGIGRVVNLFRDLEKFEP